MGEQTEGRALGIEDLKALAHPLRVQIMGALSAYGPATCSALADRLGESSGSTSYHLRQLERHGLVREDATRGNGRDRWWERMPGPIAVGAGASDEEPTLRDASALIGDEFDRVQDGLYAAFRRARATVPLDWQRAQDSSSATLQLTAAELVAMNEEFHAVLNRYRDRHGDGDRRRVSVQYRSFPIVDPTAGAPAVHTTDTDTETDSDAPEGASS